MVARLFDACIRGSTTSFYALGDGLWMVPPEAVLHAERVIDFYALGDELWVVPTTLKVTHTVQGFLCPRGRAVDGALSL
jgi:hypothetical protein